MKIKDAVAIVTGSSRGIGRATALVLAREGARVVLNARTSRAGAEEVAKEIRSLGGEALVALGDVVDFGDCGSIVRRTIETFDAVDILVNNAGVFQLKPLVEMNPQDWESMFRVHLFGSFNMIRHALPHMIERRRGVIVNLSSIVALRPPGKGRSHYAAAKGALIGLTRALALEVAESGVRVVAVAPGLIGTEMVLRGIPNLPERAKGIPVGRIGEPEEIAHTIKYAVENDFLNGETIVVAGGE